MHRGSPWDQPRDRVRKPNQRQRLNPQRPMGFDYEGPSQTAGHATNDLQLQELDLELALLKRKRQLIEKQQALANQIPPLFASKNRYDYVEPRDRFDSGPYGPSGGHMREHSDLYGQGGHSSGAGQKRGAPEAWQGGAPRARKPRMQPQSQPTRPSGPRPSAPKLAPKDKFFNPNKVTKPSYTPPNKRQGDTVNEHPIANWESTKSYPSEVYNAHKPMSPKVLGRLELALGHVLKVMRIQFECSEHAEVFRSFHCQRVLKHTIRSRIREIMQGVAVGRWDHIVTMYRVKYPEDSDGQLLEQILSANAKLKSRATIESIESANIIPYLKKNFHTLLEQTLDNMFLKVKEVYKKDTFGFQTTEEVFEESLLNFAEECDKDIEEKEKVIETTSEAVDDSSNISDKVNETPNSENTSLVEITDAQNDDNKSSTEIKNSVSENSGIENGNGDTTNLEDENKVEVIPESADSSNKAMGENFAYQKRKHDLNDDDAKARWASKFVLKLLKRQLPHELPKFKHHIIEIIKSDPEFVAMQILLGTETAKEDKTPKKETVKEVKTPKREKSDTPFNKKIYYVRIVGRPRLPPKTEMKEFLNSFNPISIKKHKSTPNILFVGFYDKDNFDNIMANTGIRIANMKLNIKESDKMINTSSIENTSKANESQQNASNKNEETSSDAVIIDENLDTQINDLLTTIRQEEEEKKSNEIGHTIDEIKTEITEDSLKVNIDEEIKPETVDAANDSTKNTEDAGDAGKESGTADKDQAEDTEVLDDDVTIINDDKKDDDVTVVTDDNPAEDEVTIVNDEEKDVVNKGLEEVKEEINQGKSTPTRASTRLAATPRSVRTRRSSKLAQN